jgi:hypothetical protein
MPFPDEPAADSPGVGSCTRLTHESADIHTALEQPRSHSHCLDSPSASLMSTPSRLLAVSNTGRSFMFHTLFLSSSRLPPEPPYTRVLASPNKLPVKLGCVALPMVPVPNESCHREGLVLGTALPWDVVDGAAPSVGVTRLPEPTGWCRSIARRGSNGSGGMYALEGWNCATKRVYAQRIVVVPLGSVGSLLRTYGCVGGGGVVDAPAPTPRYAAPYAL